MKFLVTFALLLTAASAAPAAEPEPEAAPAGLEARQTCYWTWTHIGCFPNGPGGAIASTTSYASGGGSWSWCTSWCQTNAPSSTYAGINSQNYMGTSSSTCVCGTGPSNSVPWAVPASGCYLPCAYSSKTVQQCADGSCQCGGPRAYSIFQKSQVCY
ncbi:hypothetical protein TWF694_001090 [Orbilia ellipsospora]|uniref:WSC domain-containing protein n=1 Tax=Orbilia ellipsospora TaxID=2528407 RepID=A0AAV9XT79_9PEZI